MAGARAIGAARVAVSISDRVDAETAFRRVALPLRQVAAKFF
jgi:hypothetical protein